LDTLAKLNDYAFSQLKVRKVIKSKLDDISGTTNSPLFNETSDPEVFRHHATIESLRAIWRPKLRGGGPLTPSNTVTSYHSDSQQQQQNELFHMIKGVSRSGGAAFSRVAGSIPWISTDNNKKQQQQQSQLSPISAISPITSPIDHNNNNGGVGGGEEPLSRVYTVDDTSRISVSNIPSRKLSPLSVQTSLSSGGGSESDSDLSPEANQMSPDHLDQDIPSYVQSVPQQIHSSPITNRNMPSPVPKPKLRISKSSDTNNQQFRKGDFVPYIVSHKKSLRHVRSASDSILLDPLFQDALIDKNKAAETLRTAFSKYQPPLLRHKRSLSQPTVEQQQQQRPSASMNVQTYMTYKKLVKQQRILQQTYEEMRHMADMYEKTATNLKETYEKRSKEFDLIQKESRTVMDEQNVTERRLKDAEDNSAKLHYELKVLNDKLRDIEDNVGTFYGKVGLLERKMDDSQQSITTMLIIGNYFNHYWVKVREWISWLGAEQYGVDSKEASTAAATVSASSSVADNQN
jgi:hypothetical protein